MVSWKSSLTFLLFCVFSLSALAQKQGLEAEDVFKLNFVSDLAYSPAGVHVAFVNQST